MNQTPSPQAVPVLSDADPEFLLPCPFCGSEARFNWSFGGESVECSNRSCDAGFAADTFAEAQALWNRRVSKAPAPDPTPPTVQRVLDLAYKAAFENNQYWSVNAEELYPNAKRWVESDSYAALKAAVEELGARALAPVVEPSGWKLVPIEPTEEMIEAGERHTDSYYSSLGDLSRAWAAMLAVSGSPSDRTPDLPECCTSGVGDCENAPCNLGDDSAGLASGPSSAGASNTAGASRLPGSEQ